MKLALAQEEESQRTVHGGNVRHRPCRRAGEEEAARVTVKLARPVRIAGDSLSAAAEATTKTR
jgi:hypothetical protein